MTSHTKISISTILLFFYCQIISGQKTKTETINQHITVFKIDSICKSIDDNKNLIEGIAEGEFYNQKGGWETYDLKNKKMDTLFRIRNNSSTDLYYKKTFYFFNKKVIKVVVKIEDWNSGNTMKSVYSATYYFEDDKPIEVQNENLKYSNTSEILKLGQTYISEFYKNH